MANVVRSRAEAAAALRRLNARGMVLYTSLPAPLRRAVLVHWGSMAVARKMLGLEKPTAPRQAWSRRRVIDEIAKLARAGKSLSFVDVVRAGRYDLVVAAQRYANGWVNARALAGVTFKRRQVVLGPKWDAAMVIEEIRDRNKLGLPLQATKTPKSLTSAAERLFGSWKEGVTAAGLDYDAISLLKRVDDRQLIRWLRALAREKPHWTLYDLDKHGKHTVTCRRRWGSLEDAACAAGLLHWPIRLRRPAMSRAAVLRALRKRLVAGKVLTLGALRRAVDGQFLINSVFHHFARWDDALRLVRQSQRRGTRH